jgi:hypothetical protein
VIALIGRGRSVAVVQEIDGGVYHRTIGSGAEPKLVGNLPLPDGTVFDLKARNPRFRRPWIVVEYANGAVYAAQLDRRMTLGEWVEVWQGRPTLE